MRPRPSFRPVYRIPLDHLKITLCLLLLSAGFHCFAITASVSRKVFTNSLIALPKNATSQPLRTEHLAEIMEIEIPFQMRDYGGLIEKTARQKLVTPGDLDKNHLPSPADYERVKKWLEAEGFTITQTDPNRLALFAKGSIAQIQKSLQVQMSNVTLNGKDYRAAHSQPSLPQGIAATVLGINGLQPYLQLRKKAATTTYAVPYMVGDILTAYNASDLGVTGKGQKIAILVDTVPLHSDLTAFWAANQIPQSLSNIEIVNVNNVLQSTLADTSMEETLDVEWSSSIAPGAKIRVYAAGSLKFTDVDKGLLQLLSDLPTQPQLHQLSISLGLGEADLMASSQIQTDAQYFALIAAGGVTVFAAAGDGGSTPDNNGVLQVEYYSSDPSVTGVGGTSLLMSDTGSVTSETVWSLSGGGVSRVFTRPSWQTGPGVPPGAMRLVPDVSLVADPTTGAYLYYKGAVQQIGGTSLGTPVWAAFCALINEARAKTGLAPIGLLGPNLYPLIGTQNFRDITSGNNGDYTAGIGYDSVTGIGVPVVDTLLQTLTNPASAAPSITAFSPVSGPVSSSIEITGANFDNVASVNFNGVSALFTVNSSTQITATVPHNASVGPISVVTSTGTGTSPGYFDVTTGLNITLYSTGFESDEGYVTGTLTGQNGWVQSNSGGNIVTNDSADWLFWSDGNQASIGTTAPESGTSQSVWQPLNYTPTAGEIIQFSVAMDVIDSNGDFTPRDQFRWSAYNIAGTRLFSIEFNNATNDIYYILDDDVPHLIGNLFSNNTLFLVKMTVDFSRNTWSATLNGAPLVAAVPVVTGTESPDLGGFRAEWVLNTAFAGDNYMLFDNYTVTESNLVLPISIWKSANFSAPQLLDPSISGNQANPSGDGICNLLDYAFYLNPTVRNSPSALPQASVSGSTLSLTYTTNNTATDLTYTVEVSDDLNAWQSGLGYTSAPLILSDNGITRQIQVSDLTPVTAESKRFIRLRVTGP